jgi:hypothetical protein
MTDDDRLDLSALQAISLDALAGDIARRCAPLLAERRQRRTSIQIVAWWRPALAAALVVAAASTIVLTRARPTVPVTTVVVTPATLPVMPSPRVQLALALGLPEPLVRRLARPSPPSLADLIQEVLR